MIKITNIELISKDINGNQLNGSSSTPVFSPDGNKIAFESYVNFQRQVFIKDLSTGEIAQVSTDSNGNGGNAISFGPVFSSDGTKVAFNSVASNLVPGDTNNRSDIFVKDLNTGEVTRISTDDGGVEGNNHSHQPTFSPDGTKVAFDSHANNLVPGDTNNKRDIFVKDLNTGEITRVSTDINGVEGNDRSDHSAFSPDGTKIAFWSLANNLVPGDTNNKSDVFIKDLNTGEIKRVSTDINGVEGNNQSNYPTFSPDGNKIAFKSYADNLVLGDTNNRSDIFVKDLNTGEIKRVSTDINGIGGNSSASYPAFSPDGSKITFSSYADNLVPGDTNNRSDIFVKDLNTGEIKRVSTDINGIEGNGTSDHSMFSPDGTKIAFSSSAENLVPGDINDRFDIFVVTIEKSAKNIIQGTNVSEILQGTAEPDQIAGLEGNDIIRGGSGDDCLYGEEGEDSIFGGAGDDSLFGSDGNDIAEGNSGDDVIHGSLGWDWLKGNEGNDTLIGGAQADGLFGGMGNDIFSYQNLTDSRSGLGRRDTIHDFVQGEDKMGFSVLAGGINVIGGAAFSGTSSPEARQYLEGTKTILSLDIDGNGAEDMAIAFNTTNLVFADTDFI